MTFQRSFAALVEQIRPDLPTLSVVVCLDPDGDEVSGALDFAEWTREAPVADRLDREWTAVEPVDDVAMIVGTGGTTGFAVGGSAHQPANWRR